MRIIYNNTPGNAAENKLNMTYATRISVGSMSKYSAMPPQTPAITRLEERYSFFIVVLFLGINHPFLGNVLCGRK